MRNEYGHDEELFDRTCENALNGINPEALSDEEMAIHRKWVADNWNNLNTSDEDN